jgi:hypothetical protein
MPHSTRILQAISLFFFLGMAGCGNPPRVSGVAGAPPSPSVPWKVPAGAIKSEPVVVPAAAAVVPPDLQERIRQLSLADVVDLALRNNPATRASWAQARAAASLFGSARGAYYPTLDGNATLSRIQSPSTLQRPAGKRTEYGPSIALNYLVLDFGGRSGSVERARQSLFAANLEHNATLQSGGRLDTGERGICVDGRVVRSARGAKETRGGASLGPRRARCRIVSERQVNDVSKRELTNPLLQVRWNDGRSGRDYDRLRFDGARRNLPRNIR